MKVNTTKIGIVVLCLVVPLLFLSCRKNPPSWDTQVLAPIVNASLSINNLITSSYIKSNPVDSSVSLVYTDSLYNLKLDTLFKIPDTVLRYYQADPGINYTINPGGLLFETAPTTTTYPIGTAQLVKGIIQTGFLIFTVKNPLSQPLDYVYKVLNVIKNGTDTLEVKVKVNANDSLKEQISLVGYNIDFSGPTHNSYNEIITSIQVNLDPAANAILLRSGDTLVYTTVSFTQITPYYAKGYFGTVTKTFDDSVPFPAFDKIVAGKLNLQNVNVNLSLNNGFGADARIDLTQLSSYNNRTKTMVNLVDNGVVNSTINANRAVETSNSISPVNPSVMNFNITPSNSNILAWLDNLPTEIKYSLQVEIDPLGNISGSNDFAFYGYGINSAINVTIPLSLIATNLTLADTLALNLGGSANQDQHVKSGTLTIYASNGFPFSAGLQLFLLNKNNIVTDSLFIPSQTIVSAPVDAGGVVINPKNSVLTVLLDEKHTQELYNAKSAILYAKFNMGSAPSTYRKIYSYYLLGLKVVGKFDYQIN